jgi:predicted RNA binding protein YcfA (HicA-like mRNA interferase family)
MKLPRDVSGADVVKGLIRVGYAKSRQKGDHVYLTTQRNGEHHVAVPLHDPVKLGTLHGILTSVATHLRVQRDDLVRQMKI